MSIGSKLTVAKNVVTSTAGRQLLKGQKHSPTILFGAGVIGVVATAVLASKATLKLEETLDEHEHNQYEARRLHHQDRDDYSNADYKKDLTIIKSRMAMDVVKLYAPTVVVGVATVCAFGGSHVILTRRNTALMAAYAALDRGFKEYRGRVTELVGPEKERELRFGSEEREVAVDTEKGTEVQHIKGFKAASQYARIWDQHTSTTWSPQSEYNIVTLRAHQSYLNDQLRIRGHVLLNDAYDALGLERTKAGCVVGWVKGHGDDFIDFGIFDNPTRFHEFVTGKDGAILLDFNVDGVVYDLI